MAHKKTTSTPRNAALVPIVVTLITSMIELEMDEELFSIPVRHLPRYRRPSKRRHRDKFERITEHLSDSEFRCAFRLSRRAFAKLLFLLMPRLLRDNTKARCSSGGAVQPEIRLAVTLRLLAGGSHHDQMLSFRLGKSTVYSVFHDTIRAIDDVLPMPGVPLSDGDGLRKLAIGFSESRSTPSPLFGCVGALDGIAIEIQKPPDEYVPRNFYCRKGMYALPVQAVVDSNYRFLYMSCKCSGSTHDSVAFDVSDLARRLRDGELVSGFWIAADPAYLCRFGVITPWPKSSLTGERGIFCDAFNFYHSSLRIHVEQALGMLIRRWGIFWRPLSYHIVDTLPILSAAMRLHNFAIEEDGNTISSNFLSPYQAEMSAVAFRTWWTCATTLRDLFEVRSSGRRRDLEMSMLRENLTDSLQSRGITRPAMS